LKDNNFLNETFDYDELQIDGIQYKDIHARHIFLEGFGLHQFYFNQLPLDGTKESFYHKSSWFGPRCNC
jgi:hypothetical protein